MKISLLVPTKRRPAMLRAFMDSLYKMTSQKKNIDVNFIVDDDDPPCIQYAQELITEYQNKIECHIHFVKRKYDVLQFNLNEDYYNVVARKVSGDLIWILADDLEIVSPGWDEKVQIEVTNFFVKYPDKVICVSIKDNTPPPSHTLPKFPCFPMFTKECLPAFGGWLLHPKVPTWGADYITYMIFEPTGRLLQLHDRTYINHKSWHTKQVGIDETNTWIGHVFNQTKGIPHYSTDRILAEEVPVIRGKMLDYIKNLKINQGV